MTPPRITLLTSRLRRIAFGLRERNDIFGAPGQCARRVGEFFAQHLF